MNEFTKYWDEYEMLAKRFWTHGNSSKEDNATLEKMADIENFLMTFDPSAETDRFSRIFDRWEEEYNIYSVKGLPTIV